VTFRLQLAWAKCHQFCIIFHGFNHFSPQNPNFDLPTSKFVPKGCLQVLIHKKALKVTQNLKSKHHFNIIQQFKQSFTLTFNNTQFTLPIHNYEHPMHQSINNTFHNTTTTFNHEIIHNLTTTTSFSINFVQTPNILIYVHSKHTNWTSTTQLSFKSHT